MSDFQDVSWADDEDVTADKLNQMCSNDKHLLEQTVPHLYRAYGITKVGGLKIAGGIVTLGPNAGREMSHDVNFGNFFSIGCRPVVQVTFATPQRFRVWAVIKGLGPNNHQPDRNGFTVVVNSGAPDEVKNHFPTGQHIHWMALGY